MLGHRVMIRARDDEILDWHAVLFTVGEIIFGHLLPAFGFGATHGDDQRASYAWRVFKRAVKLRDFGRHAHLFLHTYPHDHLKVENTGGGDCAFNTVLRYSR